MHTAKFIPLFLTLFSFTLFSPTIALANDTHIHGLLHTPRIKNKNGTSLNWSGYAVETNLSNPQSGAVSDVKGAWTIPTLICSSSNTYSAQWVGIDGYSDNTVEQTGTESDCINGQPSYYAWYEMYPKGSYYVPISVKAGDTLKGEVHYTGNGSFQLTLTSSNGQHYSTIKRLNNAQRQSAEWIVEAPWSGGTLPLANFGTQQINTPTATINGKTGSIYNSTMPSETPWVNDPITMEAQNGNKEAIPSMLATDGSSFTVQWLSSK